MWPTGTNKVMGYTIALLALQVLRSLGLEQCCADIKQI